MRSLFVEGDLVSVEVKVSYHAQAEIQNVDSRGSASIHTRSPKYGKVHLEEEGNSQLTNGVLVTVPSVLIKKLKQHFVNLDCDVGCIFGNNGNIWVTERLVDMEGNSINSTSSAETDKKKKMLEQKVISPETRTRITKVVQCIRTLELCLM